MIHHTRGEHTNNYTTEAFHRVSKIYIRCWGGGVLYMIDSEILFFNENADLLIFSIYILFVFCVKMTLHLVPLYFY